jgi:HEAT repeat protein
VSVEDRTGRALKREVLDMLVHADLDQCIRALLLFPARKVINPLFSLLLHQDDTIRWRAVTAFGAVVSNLADQDKESARVIMRRLMWSLNDESGGIGWGAPEAMAEVIARNDAMAEEFGTVFVSYLDPEGNFLEYPPLQRGLLWGLARLAEVRSACVASAIEYLAPYLESEDPTIRGLAALVAGRLGARELRPTMERLLVDEAEFAVFHDDRFESHKVGKLAQQGIALLDERG